MNFAERHGLWTDEQAVLAREIEGRIAKGEIDLMRLSFADQHGILRGKSLIADDKLSLGNGCALTTTLLLKDTSHRTVFPVWQPGGAMNENRLDGASDFTLVPDPATFRMLPWAPGTGWVLCDIYYGDGAPMPFSTRQILRNQLARLEEQGKSLITGLEVEFHVFQPLEERLAPEDATHPGAVPGVELIAQGYQYLTENRFDELADIMDLIRTNLIGLGLPLRSMEVEFGPSQVELTFHPDDALTNADNFVLLRGAVKQVCEREGLHATFMCRPHLTNIFSSGWHLHQSITDAKSGENLFAGEGEDILSAYGLHYAGGLLEHAHATSVFTTPTINGYKRYRPHALAPDRAVWGYDNRGTMIRACGQPGDDSAHIENRAGEPAANSYLYTASQIIAGLDGVEKSIGPGPAADAPYDAAAARLPTSLMDAVSALRKSRLFKEQLGEGFIEYICTIKEAEISRFLSETTDWEMREYFQSF
ncbi:MAG: glutamine synthetase family protein [Hyphomicrobiales bacterium]